MNKLTFSFYLVESDDAGIIETLYTFPGKYVVCSMCEGHGRVRNPDTNRHTVFRSVCQEIVCQGCDGDRVKVDVDVAALNDKQQRIWRRHQINIKKDESNR